MAVAHRPRVVKVVGCAAVARDVLQIGRGRHILLWLAFPVSERRLPRRCGAVQRAARSSWHNRNPLFLFPVGNDNGFPIALLLVYSGEQVHCIHQECPRSTGTSQRVPLRTAAIIGGVNDDSVPTTTTATLRLALPIHTMCYKYPSGVITKRFEPRLCNWHYNIIPTSNNSDSNSKTNQKNRRRPLATVRTILNNGNMTRLFPFDKLLNN